MRHRYTDEEREYINSIHKGRSAKEIAEMMNERFGNQFTQKMMRHYLSLHRMKTGYIYIPSNKGKKMSEEFRELHRQLYKNGGKFNLRYKPVGSEQIDSDGYVNVKVADPNVWRRKHQIIWEQANGRPVPDGHIVIFANKNIMDFRPENLLLVTRPESVVMNRCGLHFDDAELTKTGLNIAKLKIKIRDRKRHDN